MAAIVVQPPSQTMANAHLYPPVIARMKVEGIVGAEQTDYNYVFAQAVLLDASGNVLEGVLEGTVAITGTSVTENWGSGGGGNSRSRRALYFVFSDLRVPYAGTYSIRIDVWHVENGVPSEATFIDQTETRIIYVYSEQVAAEKPSSGERTLLRRLQERGLTLPAAPA